MSAYDDAVAYLDAEVHPRCDYEIYSDMRDIVDEMEAENAKLREELADARQIMADELERQISDYRARHIEQVGTITELESENAELRERVVELEELTDGKRYIPQEWYMQLNADNAKLREDNDRLIEAIEELHSVSLEDRLVQLEGENSRLRKLLQDVAICASGNYCYDCPHQHDGCDRDERLRAEGIEV